VDRWSGFFEKSQASNALQSDKLPDTFAIYVPNLQPCSALASEN